MPGEFPYDVFLSHSAKDKPVVRDVAERLKQDGLRVWFDEFSDLALTCKRKARNRSMYALYNSLNKTAEIHN